PGPGFCSWATANELSSRKHSHLRIQPPGSALGASADCIGSLPAELQCGGRGRRGHCYNIRNNDFSRYLHGFLRVNTRSATVKTSPLTPSPTLPGLKRLRKKSFRESGAVTGAKARIAIEALTARPSSCPDTKHGLNRVFR